MQPLSNDLGLTRDRAGLRAPAASSRRTGSVHLWEIEAGAGPVVAVALHAGHRVRPEVARHLALGEEVRLREEDPSTERFAELGTPRVVARVSRFEADLNRPREEAVYRGPESAWGLDVWGGGPPPADVVELALREYDAFYAAMEELFGAIERRWGRFAVLDLHSYNHRRAGPAAPPDDPFTAPDVNVGTGWIDRRRWAPVVERFVAELASRPFLGRRLDVRENVRFRGGHFPRWLAETFPESACPLAVEIKKIYMDEWTGETYLRVVEELRRALAAAVPGVAATLHRMGGRTALREP